MSIVNLQALKNLNCQLWWSGNVATGNLPKSITSYGDCKQLLPYPGAGIGMFDGSGDYLTIPDNDDWYFGSNSFCIEFYMFLPTTPPVQYTVFHQGTDASNRITIDVASTTNQVEFQCAVGGTYVWNIHTNNLSVNTFYHIACVRNGNTQQIYVNGLQNGTTATSSSTVSNFTGLLYVGRYPHNTNYDFGGWLSEFKITNGSAIYTSNFTPPRSQLQSDANTKLLLHFLGSGNSFVDSSPSPKVITAYGDAKQLSSPVGSGVAIFNGTTSYVSTPSSSDIQGNLTNFTWELTILRSQLTASYVQGLIGIDSSNGSTNRCYCRITGDNKLYFILFDTSGVDHILMTAATITSLTTWYHIAFVKNGNIITCYINGVADSNTLDVTGYTLKSTTSAFSVGAAGEYYTAGDFVRFYGYIGEVRISNTARYSGATITIPTTPFKPDPYTKLLLHMDGIGAAFYDSSDPPGDNGFPILPDGVTITPAGTFTINKLKNGLNCYKFDGSTNYITISDHESWTLFEGDFTIAGWINFTTIVASKGIIGQYADANNYWSIVWDTSNVIQLYGITSSTVNFNYTCPLIAAANTWYHLVVIKSGTTCLMYINGSPVTVTVGQAFRNTTNIAAVLSLGRSISTYYQLGNEKDMMVFKGRVLNMDQIGALIRESYIY